MNKAFLPVIFLLTFISILGFLLSLNFPDLDISILGIGMHRFFLFHSAIIPLFFYIAIKLLFKPKRNIEILITTFCGSFTFGVGIHLFLDIFQSKAIIFPFIGSLINGTSTDDRIWLTVNVLICFIFSILLYKKIIKSLGL